MENIIQKLYHETFDEIVLPQETRERLVHLSESDQRKEIPMKHVSKKMMFAVAAVLVLCLGGTCYAALRAVRTDSSVAPAALLHGYSAVAQAQEETGLLFNCPESLGLGFTFHDLNINNDTDYDENGEVAGTYQSVYVGYLNDSQAVIYQVSPMQEAASQAALDHAAAAAVETASCATGAGETVTLYYQVTQLNYGEDGPFEEESVIWSDGNNFYSLSGYDLNLTCEEWFSLAEAVL